MNSDHSLLFRQQMARFLADEGRWRQLCRPWFAKPVPVFFRSKTRTRDRRRTFMASTAGS